MRRGQFFVADKEGSAASPGTVEDMAKSTRNNGKPWTTAEKGELRKLATGNTPTGVISLKMGRSKEAIRSQASRQNTSLQPTNRRPYNRKRK